MARVIVRYHGDLKNALSDFVDTSVVELFHQYAIVTTTEQNLTELAALPEVEYVEPPETLFFNLQKGRNASCIAGVQGGITSEGGDSGLTGKGVLVAILDSGIDYAHPTFISEDGKSRIRFLWDQTVSGQMAEGRMPERYDMGAEYTNAEIDEALALPRAERSRVIPTTDSRTGHGTAVAGIAAGNGRGSASRRYRGIAIDSELLIVKLANSGDGYSKTTEVMMGLDYVLHKSLELEMPICINLSFGNNYGPHNGQSLFENYITELNGIGKNNIIIATGNEGDKRHHVTVDLKQGAASIQFAVADAERTLVIQMWKQYVDTFQIELTSPSGKRYRVPAEPGEILNQEVQVYYGEASPYRITQEIYFRWVPPASEMIESGVWRMDLQPIEIRDGRINLWMSGSEVIGLRTGFLQPTTETTMTIPSTADKVISVGAYDAATGIIPAFSGRGRTADGRLGITMVAPGVDVQCPAPGGGYSSNTGTSMAAPFVTGAAALLMEWGIIQGNDPYLYGEKLKAYLMKGARGLAGEEMPSVRQGWGALCIRDSIPN